MWRMVDRQSGLRPIAFAIVLAGRGRRAGENRPCRRSSSPSRLRRSRASGAEPEDDRHDAVFDRVESRRSNAGAGLRAGFCRAVIVVMPRRSGEQEGPPPRPSPPEAGEYSRFHPAQERRRVAERKALGRSRRLVVGSPDRAGPCQGPPERSGRSRRIGGARWRIAPLAPSGSLTRRATCSAAETVARRLSDPLDARAACSARERAAQPLSDSRGG